MKDLIVKLSIPDLCTEYQKAQSEVKQAFEMLATAKKRLRAAFGQYADTVLSRNTSDYDLEDESKKIAKTIKRNVWSKIFDKIQVKELLSMKANAELRKQLEDDTLPEVTFENVKGIIDNLTSKVPALLEETIKETFEILRPRSHFKNSFKTNSEYEIGAKVILDYMIDNRSWSGWRLRNDDSVRCIDNVFHLLDGKGPIKYPGDAITLIKDTMSKKENQVATPYFDFKWFKKGTLHISFLRPDLVAELNKIAGGNRLRED